jgi:wobble nucleotide-excising tRNase
MRTATPTETEMKKFVAFLTSLFGKAEKEYHHIVDQFHTAVDDLHSLAARKKAEAEKLAEEISVKATEQSKALSTSLQASQTATGIRKMLAGG